MTVDHGEGHRWFRPLADVDPPLAEHALALLDEAGIPAYAEPLAGEAGPYRDVRSPDRPLTRLYVDSHQIAPAREVLRSAFPPIRADFLADAAARADREATAKWQQDALDSAWAGIVAEYGPTPGLPDGADPADSAPLSSRLIRSGSASSDDGDDLDNSAGSLGAHDTYEPPTPPPLPRPADRLARAAWAGALGGPVALVAGWAFGLESWVSGLGLLAFIAGFATLVARMKDRRDDGWDDGAVV